MYSRRVRSFSPQREIYPRGGSRKSLFNALRETYDYDQFFRDTNHLSHFTEEKELFNVIQDIKDLELYIDQISSISWNLKKFARHDIDTIQQQLNKFNYPKLKQAIDLAENINVFFSYKLRSEYNSQIQDLRMSIINARLNLSALIN